MATEKVTWIYDAKDKLTPELKGMNRQYDKLQSNAKKTESSISRGFSRGKQSITDFADEIPMAGKAMRFLTSPAGLAAGAIGGIGVAASKAVGEAEKFDRAFLQIEQMNLNKPKEQMEAYKNSIIETGKEIDAMPKQAAKAFFDVQSATGMFGSEVENLVSKIGKFSDAVNADLDSSINAGIKLYRNFDIEASNFDRALESNIKTVQTGITTYDQLAKVQADYAGTASAANQSIDSANKLFAAFTANAKNTEEAATLTKTAFESLSEAKVVNTLEDFNINVTDANGNLLQMEPLVRNMVNTLDELSPEQVRKLKDEVGGTEGMTMLLNQAQASGDELLKTFKKFDETDADISKVTEKAKGDLSEIKEDIMADINAEFANAGDNLLPVWVDIMKKFREELKLVNDMMSAEGFKDFAKQAGEFITESRLGPISYFKDIHQGAANAIGIGGGDQDIKNPNKKQTFEGPANPQNTQVINSLAGANQQSTVMDKLNQQASLANMVPGGSSGKKRTDESAVKEQQQEQDDVVTGGKRTKVVRVSIENLVNELEFNTQNIQEGFQDMEEGVKQALIRAVQDAEITLSEG